MVTAKVKLDIIGQWSQVKLEIIEKYAAAYSKVMRKQPSILKYIYIDAFAGPGIHVSKSTREQMPGSPLNALSVDPPFHEYHFIDLESTKVSYLNAIVGERQDVFLYPGDCNKILLDTIFPRCRYEDYSRGLCLLDPYQLAVRWEVLQTAGKMKSIELFYNFMIMDANMNVLPRDPDKAHEGQKARMDSAWGDRSWREAAYEKTPLFGYIEEKTTNERVARAFQSRLRNIAGFKYVPDPIPMKNSKGAVIYYLFFASQNKTGAGIVKEIFDKYR